MWRKVCVAVLTVQLAVSSGAANAAYDEVQLRQLNLLLNKGDTTELVRFWNSNISSYSRRTEVERLLEGMMNEVRDKGAGDISADLRDASDRSISRLDGQAGSAGANRDTTQQAQPVWASAFQPILAALSQ